MSDLISRQAAIDAITEIDDGINMDISTNEVRELLCEVPSAQPERKTGRWIKVGHIENTYLVSKCSVCGYQTIDAGNYCTNCGARMEVEHETD